MNIVSQGILALKRKAIWLYTMNLEGITIESILYLTKCQCIMEQASCKITKTHEGKKIQKKNQFQKDNSISKSLHQTIFLSSINQSHSRQRPDHFNMRTGNYCIRHCHLPAVMSYGGVECLRQLVCHSRASFPYCSLLSIQCV